MEKVLQELTKRNIKVLRTSKGVIVVRQKDLVEATNVRNEVDPNVDSFGFHAITIASYL